MSDTPYYLSTCSPYSETAAMNPMKPYSKEDAAEIIAHEGGTAYVLASDFEAVTRERDESRALNAAWAEKAATWMASPEAAARLQGYRDMGKMAADAENERDALRAEVEALRGALQGLEAAYCRAGDALTKAERHEDRLRLIAARAALTPTEVTK